MLRGMIYHSISTGKHDASPRTPFATAEPAGSVRATRRNRPLEKYAYEKLEQNQQIVRCYSHQIGALDGTSQGNMAWG